MTGNLIIDKLIGEGNHISAGNSCNRKCYGISFHMELHDDYCKLTTESDNVEIMYSYSPEETNLCLDMLCNYKLYQLLSHEDPQLWEINIYCKGLITALNDNGLFSFWSPWFGSSPTPEYLAKTRNALLKFSEHDSRFLNEEEFVDLYNYLMSQPRVKNARSIFLPNHKKMNLVANKWNKFKK